MLPGCVLWNDGHRKVGSCLVRRQVLKLKLNLKLGRPLCLYPVKKTGQEAATDFSVIYVFTGVAMSAMDGWTGLMFS